MAPVSDQLRAVGIVLRRHEPGTRKTTCPQCSHLRRKRAEACLSVTIEPGHAVWHCHNCGWFRSSYQLYVDCGDYGGLVFWAYALFSA